VQLAGHLVTLPSGELQHGVLKLPTGASFSTEVGLNKGEAVIHLSSR
jgi:hypothetical protein